MPRHSAPQQPTRLRPRLVVVSAVAAAGLVTAVWLPTRNDSADAAERARGDRDRAAAQSTFADDFSGRRGSTVDPGRWALSTSPGQNGVQFSQSTRNARLDGNGNLEIVLRSEDRGRLSSALLVTKSSLQAAAGHVEARIKTPDGQGLKPGFALVGGSRQSARILDVLSEPVSGDFHTYAADWTAEEIVFSIDGAEYDRKDLQGVDTGQSFHLALSLSTGGDRSATSLPARLFVDTVSFTAAGASAPTKPPASPPTTTPSPAPTEEPTSPPTTVPPTTTPPTTAPTTAPPTSPPPSAPAATEWAAFTDYVAGQLVTYKGVEYQVQETHTSLPGWEPTALPSLFTKL